MDFIPREKDIMTQVAVESKLHRLHRMPVADDVLYETSMVRGAIAAVIFRGFS